MIQRILSVYLALAAALLGFQYLYSSVYPWASTDAYAWLSPTVLALFTLAGIGALGTIFLYKDRKRQRSLVVILQILTLVGLIILIVANYTAGTLPGISMSDAAFSHWAALVSPIMAYLMFLMARRGIDKDISLIRSMDRLR